MARFCGMCGSPLDPATGLCLNCNAGQVHMAPATQDGVPADGLGQTEIVDAGTVQGDDKATGAEPASMQGQVTDAVVTATPEVAFAPDMARPQRRAGRVVAVVGGLILLVALVAGLLVIGDRTGVLALTTQGKVTRQLSLGQKYLLEEDYEQAVIAFNKAIELDPREARAYTGLMDAYLGIDDADAAYDCYMTAQDVEELAGEVTLAAYGDRIAAALQEHADAAEDVEEQIRLTEMLVALCPEEPTYREELEALRNPQDDVDETTDGDGDAGNDAAEADDEPDEEDEQEPEQDADKATSYQAYQTILNQYLSGDRAWGNIGDSYGDFPGVVDPAFVIADLNQDGDDELYVSIDPYGWGYSVWDLYVISDGAIRSDQDWCLPEASVQEMPDGVSYVRTIDGYNSATDRYGAGDNLDDYVLSLQDGILTVEVDYQHGGVMPEGVEVVAHYADGSTENLTWDEKIAIMDQFVGIDELAQVQALTQENVDALTE